MRKIIVVMATLFMILIVAPAHAECKNELALLKTFPDDWTLKWQYNVGELTVREYRSLDNWLGIYYRIDYPAHVEEALITEAPSEINFSSGMLVITPGERHSLIRLVKPKINLFECWNEVYDFKVEVHAKVGEPGVWFFIVEKTQKQEGQ